MWFMGNPVTFHEIIRKIVSQVSFHSINLSLVHSGLVVKGSWAIQGNNSESKNPLGNSGLFVKVFWAIQGNNLHVQWQPNLNSNKVKIFRDFFLKIEKSEKFA